MKIMPIYLGNSTSGKAIHAYFWRLEVAIGWTPRPWYPVVEVKRRYRAGQFRIGGLMFGWNWRAPK